MSEGLAKSEAENRSEKIGQRPKISRGFVWVNNDKEINFSVIINNTVEAIKR